MVLNLASGRIVFRVRLDPVKTEFFVEDMLFSSGYEMLSSSDSIEVIARLRSALKEEKAANYIMGGIFQKVVTTYGET
ncbi:unnamed protein product [Urochloa humidicola]